MRVYDAKYNEIHQAHLVIALSFQYGDNVQLRYLHFRMQKCHAAK